MRVAVAILVLAGVLLVPTGGDPGARRVHGRPVEATAPIAVDKEADEEENHERRLAWIEQRHRAPPDVDWRSVERANGLTQVRQRNTMAGHRLGEGPWIERGSDNLAGSMYDAMPASDGVHLYAGAALGGLWRGTLDGQAWEPLGDNLFGGVHFLVVIPRVEGTDTVLAGSESGLVHRSDDHGKTWIIPDGVDPLPLALRRLTRGTDGRIWLVGMWGDWWEPEWRILRSDDDGRSFARIFDTADVAGDAWVSRTGPPEVWVAGPWLKHSADGGQTWETHALPEGGGEITLAAHEGGRLWVVVGDAASTLYRSDDGGENWKDLGELEDFWGPIAASTMDPDLIAYGGMEVHVSRSGGSTFRLVNSWIDYYEDPLTKLHADLMAFNVIPTAEGERWYLGTHGGVYRSDDSLNNVQNLSLRGLRVSQYYDTDTSHREGWNVAAGAQDQGWQYSVRPDSAAGLPFDFAQISSGDFGQLSTGDGTHDFLYGVYPGFIAVQIGEDAPVVVSIDYPDDPAIAPWLPPVVADPSDASTFFFFGSKAWRFRWDDGWWKEKEWSDGPMVDEQGDYVTAVAFSPRNPDVAWASTSSGRILRTDDHARTWERRRGTGPVGNYYYGAAVLASSRDVDEAWIGGSGYGGTSIYHTDDGGQSWLPWDQGLPDTLVYCLCEAPDGSGTIFAGTETSAWMRAAGEDSWVEITGVQAPITNYWSCETLFHEATVRFSTYGRGIWDYRLAPPGEGCFGARDEDGDGYGCNVDCDDDDVDVHPDLEDLCDGRDLDCDGQNEDDADGDGMRACYDCDDSDPAVRPGKLDACGDAIDADCDGIASACAPAENGCQGCDTTHPMGLASLTTLMALVYRRRRET